MTQSAHVEAPSEADPFAARSKRRRAGTNGIVGFVVGIAGGLIGLGGAELRLPYLVGVLRLTPRQAIRANLAISLFTILAAVPARLLALRDVSLDDFVAGTAGIVIGAVIAAYFGAGTLNRLSERTLGRMIFVVMLVLGVSLVVEAALGLESDGFLPGNTAVAVVCGVLFGFVIGGVSSLLGVAGGEVIIPTLVFAYGAPIKAAGTLSMMISLPTVSTGLGRHLHSGAMRDRALLTGVVAPMAAGSVAGAVVGALLVDFVPGEVVKVLLGLLLIWSAWKVFSGGHQR